MGFDQNILGLAGERVTSRFGELRGDCPHKGTDYSSSNINKDFCAGVYGKVIKPTEEGEWGTIAIQPFHNLSYTIQYIHCSVIYVGVGQIVYPWTRIGKTGDTAPPGTSITGIHLHLQIFRQGRPQYPCWGVGRNFVDPENWNIKSHLNGTWYYNSVDVVKGVTIEMNDRIIFNGDTVGSSIIGEGREFASMISPRDGKLYSIEQKANWRGILSNLWQDGLQIDVFKGTCIVNSNPPTSQICHANPSTFVLKMISPNNILSENTNKIWVRTEANKNLEIKKMDVNQKISYSNDIKDNELEEVEELLKLIQKEKFLNEF